MAFEPNFGINPLPRIPVTGRTLTGIPLETDAEGVEGDRKIWKGELSGTLKGMFCPRAQTQEEQKSPKFKMREEKETSGTSGSDYDLEKEESQKYITFYFLRTGNKTNTAIKKTQLYLESHADVHEVSGDDVQLIPAEAVGAKSATEYLFHEIPKSMGMIFSHVEVKFHDVEIKEPETGETQRIDEVYTSYLDANGPSRRVNKTLYESYYTDAWQIATSPELFYAARSHANGIVAGDGGYNMTDYVCLRFLHTPVAPIINYICFSGRNTYSCSKIALEIIQALKLGSRNMYISAYNHVDISPDQIYTLLGRFAFINCFYREEVCRKSNMGQLTDETVDYLEKQLTQHSTLGHVSESEEDTALPEYTTAGSEDEEVEDGVIEVGLELVSYLITGAGDSSSYEARRAERRKVKKQQRLVDKELSRAAKGYVEKYTKKNPLPPTGNVGMEIGERSFLGTTDNNLSGVPDSINHKKRTEDLFLMSLKEHNISSMLYSITLVRNSFSTASPVRNVCM